VREAVFSTLQSRIGSLDGTRVLDLYAGSGAMGLEALSRGAASVVFVESNRAVARTLNDNIDRVGLPGTETVTADVAVFAKETPDRGRIDAARHPFDLVLCDPPYALGVQQLREVLVDLVRSGWLAGECELIVERDARDDAPPWPEGEVIRDSSSGNPHSRIAAQDRRTYGDTALWYGRLVERAT
jgi:16S rRNA (guanine966-N2)-methyltransferase